MVDHQAQRLHEEFMVNTFQGIRFIINMLLFIGLIFTLGCGSGSKSDANTSSSKDINTFTFKVSDNDILSSDAIGVITGANIEVSVPAATDVTTLVATFTTTGMSVTLAGVTQVSGATSNDFTAPVTYKVKATDNTTKFYTVTVTIRSTPNVSHLAGSLGGPGKIDSTGTTARFREPTAITNDGTNLYIADTNNHTIRQIVIATGVVTTLAGEAMNYGSSDGYGAAARFYSPSGITTDGTNLYVADTDNHTIRQIVIATRNVTTLAGTAGSAGSNDGTGASARFDHPYGISTDGSNLFISDSYNHTIRQLVIATGVVTTLAGSAGNPGSNNGMGSSASFALPCGITTDGSNLYVADHSNHTIRQIVIASGTVTTLAGTAGLNGSTNGTGSTARFDYPYGITTDGTNLYVADTYNHIIRQIVIATGVVTTMAGSADSSGSTDDAGTSANFYYPQGITVDGSNLYIADTNNNIIRKLVIPINIVSTLAGMAVSQGSSDGTGTTVSFNNPSAITTDGTNLFIADSENHTIRKIVISTGVVTTLAGTAGSYGSTDGTGTAARFYNPSAITTDGTNLYVADTFNSIIRKIVISNGAVTTLAGTAGSAGFTDGTGAAAKFLTPYGITTDGLNLYVSDTLNQIIRKIVISSGVVTTLAGTYGSAGSADGIGTAASFNYPRGITTDGSSLYIADGHNFTIRQLVISTGAVKTLAGTAGIWGSNDGTGAAAKFGYPLGITTDGSNLYVTDTGSNTIRQIVISTKVVTTLAGTAGYAGCEDGSLSDSTFNAPVGIIYDSSGYNLFITDVSNCAIRWLSL